MANSITSLTLVNADTGADILTLTPGTTLNLATLPTRKLNVRANTSPAVIVGSVAFNLDGKITTEATAPYALAGDAGGKYNAWTPSVGAHTLVVTPTGGTAVTVQFTVTDAVTVPPPPPPPPPPVDPPPAQPAGPNPVLYVKDYGVKFDGSTDDWAALQKVFDMAFGPEGSPNGTAGIWKNRPILFSGGQCHITKPIRMRSVRGAHVSGLGRFVSGIRNVAGGNVFETNGCEYSVFERFGLGTSGSGVSFDLNWDNTGPTALQSNTFADMVVGGGAYGVRIGEAGFMGSENLFLNLFAGSCSVAGLAARNYNALQNTVLGGNYQSNKVAILVDAGSFPNIASAGFQLSGDYDIKVNNTAGDCYAITACRSESTNFVMLHNGAAGVLSCCTQTGGEGIFAYIEGGSGNFPGSLMADACFSVKGKFIGNGKLYLRGNMFKNTNYLSGFAGQVAQNI